MLPVINPRYTSRPLRLAASAAVTVAVLAAPVIPAAAAQVSAKPAFGRAVELRLPASAAADHLVSLHGLACTGRGDCVAGVAYNDKRGHQQAALISQSHGSWGKAVQVLLPADAAPQPRATINGIACPQPGGCVAVGNYATAGSVRAFIVTESHGKWGRAVPPHLPNNAVPAQNAYLQGIACTGPGACAAVGSFADIEGHFEPMAISQAHGTWQQATELKLPADAGTLKHKKAYPLGIDCRTSGNCVAVGDYVKVLLQATARVAMGVSESNGGWARAREVTLPADAHSGSTSPPFASLVSVACLSNGSCLGAGYYQSGSAVHAMTSVESNGNWSPAAQLLAVPRGASFAVLDQISCRASTFCLSVGSYHKSHGNFQPLAVTWTGHGWTAAGTGTPPANAATGRSAASLLTAVSCVSATYCEALGSYRDKSGKYQVMALTMS